VDFFRTVTGFKNYVVLRMPPYQNYKKSTKKNEELERLNNQI